MDDTHEVKLTGKIIRETLWKEVQRAIKGEITPEKMNAVSNGVRQVLSEIRLEMEAYKLSGKNPTQIPFFSN